MLDFETLLAPVTPEQPSGLLLEYDPAFTALLEMAKGKPEQQMGASVIPAEPPDWRGVEEGALALLGRTKDLRLAALLAKARLHAAGVAGFFEGLALLRALLERHWDTLHPQLDPEDGNDPAMRINALADLVDPATVLASLRSAELASARGVGRIRVRDLERQAQGTGAAAADGAPDGAPDGEEKAPAVDTVLAVCDGAALARTAAGATAALADLRAIEAFVREKVGGERAPDLSRLAALLQLVVKAFSGWGDGAGTEGEPPQARPVATAAGGEPAAPGPGARPAGPVGSRSDVLRALDDICAYYERFEPSSPVPLLLRRSRRLVHMSFMDIVRDLVPEAVAHVEALRGKED